MVEEQDSPIPSILLLSFQKGILEKEKKSSIPPIPLIFPPFLFNTECNEKTGKTVVLLFPLFSSFPPIRECKEKVSQAVFPLIPLIVSISSTRKHKK